MACKQLLVGLFHSNIHIQHNAYRGHIALFTTIAPKVPAENMADAKPFEEIPGPTGIYSWPVIGTLLHFKPFTKFVPERSYELIDYMFDKYGPIYKWNSMVMVYRPQDIETVFRNEGKYPIRPTTPIEHVYAQRSNATPGILEVHGEKWQALRTPLNKRLMKVNSASYYLGHQNIIADDFVKILARNDKSPEDLAEVFFSYAAECIGVVCFNTRLGFLDPDAMQNPETLTFLKASKDVFIYAHKSLSQRTYNWYRSTIYRKYEWARLKLSENTLKRIENANRVLEQRKKDGTFDPEELNLLQSLLSDSSLDYANVVRLMEQLYFAGTDSTAKNLQTFFYNLAINPDKQEKLRKEILNVLGQDEPLTAEAVAKMPYLKACLKESFRCLPPVLSGTSRVLPTDVVLCGYRVPAGTFVGVHTPRASREYFSNPDKFIPERWLRSLDGVHEEEIPMTASLPFGFGPRNCVGRRFAEQEIYLATVKVLQKLKITVDNRTNFFYMLFIQPEKPIKFKFTKLDG